jgi:hypothetical protein
MNLPSECHFLRLTAGSLDLLAIIQKEGSS